MSTAVFAEDFISTDLSIWKPPPTQEVQIDGRGIKLQAGGSERKRLNFTKTFGQQKVEAERQKIEYQEDQPCDEEYFFNLRNKCVELIWECLQGLISILDAQDFRIIQGDLTTFSADAEYT